MFDESYCAGMSLGEPQISIAGLLKFAAALAAFATQTPGARSHPSKRKERDIAEKSISQPGAARSLSRTPSRRPPVVAKSQGADLLLVALGVQCRMVKGGDDEHQDHA
jgi:hypothetical protein